MKTVHSLLLLSLLLLSGCHGGPTAKIATTVIPVSSLIAIDKIYVQKNEKVLLEKFTNEIVSQIRDLGIEAEPYTSERNTEMKH